MKKILYSFFLLSCISFTTTAQPTCINWQHSFGGSSDDELGCIQKTSDGGYISAGYSRSADGDITGNHGLYDYWVIKHDNAGNMEWQRSFGGAVSDYGFTIRQTNNGGYIVGGTGRNPNDSMETGNHGDGDFWILKLDGTGNIEWQKSYGGSNYDAAYSIQQTSDNGFIITGYSASTDGDVTGNHGGGDCWVIKTDGLGNIEWQRSLGGTAEDWGASVFQMADGYMIGGGTNSTDGDVTGNHGDYDYWVIKLDLNGNLQWQKALGGSVWDNLITFIPTSDGGSLAAGYVYSNDGNITGFHQSDSSDTWLVKLDAAGNIQWQKCYGGTADDWANSIQETADHGFIVAGVTNSYNGDLLNYPTHSGSSDAWIMQVDNLGNIVWQRVMGGSGDDGASYILQDADAFVAGGYTNSTDGDVLAIDHHGDFDYWVLKLPHPTSSTTTIDICAGQLPYSWNGSVFNSAGTYLVHLTNTAGCDSSATLNLQLKVFSKGTILGPANSCAFTGPLGGDATYSVINSVGATGYNWNVPPGAAIMSGQGTSTINVHYLPLYVAGIITVYVVDPCASFLLRENNATATCVTCRTTDSTPKISGTPPPPPSSPSGAYNASVNVNTGVAVRYTAPVAPAGSPTLTYLWTVPAHARIISHSRNGNTTNSSNPSSSIPESEIDVVFDSLYTTSVFKVKAVSGCGASTDRSFTIIATVPANPGAITGPVNSCLYYTSPATYTIRKVANANSYIWLAPPGATVTHLPLISPENDTMIFVTYSANTPDNTPLTVRASNGVGPSVGASSLTIKRISPSMPGVINGVTDVCQFMAGTYNPVGTALQYVIAKAPNATSYIWKVPTGTVVTHPGGAGTVNDTIIQLIFFDSNFIKDTISVAAQNGCFISAPRIKLVSRTLPPTPGTITGPVDACPYAFNGTEATYSIRKVLGTAPASSYEWSVSDPINSHIYTHIGVPGFDDTAITVHFDAAYTTGSVSVKAIRNCGASANKTLLVTKKAPATPTISGNAFPCPLSTDMYSANSVTGNSYIWTVPATVGTYQVMGDNAALLVITFKSTFVSGTISVKAVSVCGTSIVKTFLLKKCTTGTRSVVADPVVTNSNTVTSPVILPVKTDPVPAVKTVKSMTVKQGVVSQSERWDIIVYPNPSKGDFNIAVKNTSSKLKEDAVISITNEFGQVVYNNTIKDCFSGKDLKIKNNFTSGIYIINCIIDGEKISKKLVIDR